MAISNTMKGGMLALGALTVVAIGGSSIASAHSGNNNETIADKIATKFNLNKEEVKAVFDEERQAMHAEMEAETSKQLQEAVDSGKITNEQKGLIEKKLKEVHATREAEREALNKWASDNMIDLKYLMIGGKRGGSENMLQKAVDAGSITVEQKTLIQNKQAELKTTRESNKSELEAWAKNNNIDAQLLKTHSPEDKGQRGGMYR